MAMAATEEQVVHPVARRWVHSLLKVASRG